MRSSGDEFAKQFLERLSKLDWAWQSSGLPPPQIPVNNETDYALIHMIERLM